MAQQQVSFFQDGVDRLREAVGSIEDEFERVQKDLRKRRRSLEKQVNTGRRDLERRAKRFQRDLSRNDTVKQVENLRKRAGQQLEQSIDGVLSLLQIASKSDVQRIDRKISQLNKRLRELDGKKRRANGRA